MANGGRGIREQEKEEKWRSREGRERGERGREVERGGCSQIDVSVRVFSNKILRVCDSCTLMEGLVFCSRIFRKYQWMFFSKKKLRGGIGAGCKSRCQHQ